ncbi:fructokinase [Vibrio inusitatus NBRC 102082]|uniref:Fructokinase n=1 Tax=Vibrio inusitatus NBRC 102082 TaxID=1219070 RepID=A0A4Y3I0Y4_9VIBR|nr:ROK family protein [Vibrio inusitatus]GEA52124.1 fructokinase [Vibrio inusitatus NBRC 102082]
MYIGFDIGGTKIEACVLNDATEILYKERVSTPRNYDEFIHTIVHLVHKIETELHIDAKVGLGLPGSISPISGLVKNANCTFLNGHDLKGDLERFLSRVISIENDANCFALSESVDGAAVSGRLVFGAILGTGCGGGLIIDKQIWRGRNAIAGEWGHNSLPSYSLEKDGPSRQCYCGKSDCIEQYISGTGLELSYKLATGITLGAKGIIELVKQDEEQAVQCYKLFIDQAARAFSQLINVMDPDDIIIGGGLSNYDAIYNDISVAIQKYLFTDVATVSIKKAKFGDSSGVRGAAWLSRS